MREWAGFAWGPEFPRLLDSSISPAHCFTRLFGACVLTLNLSLFSLYKNHYVNRCIEGLKNRNLFRKTSTVSTADRKKVAEMICDYL